jgi:chloramphenicol-sensitive protein RarD
VTEQRKGLIQGIVAYALWGVVAAYWKLLAHVDPIEIIAHRAVWGLGAFATLVIIFGEHRTLLRTLRDARTVGVMAASAALLACNWGIFVAATTTGHLLDASLGYFINPLVSIALGTLVLRERLRRLQWVAIALAAVGVAFLTWRAGRLPWISLLLAGSWGLYGLVRKTARVEALVGGMIETILIAPIALLYLAVLASHGGGAFGHAGAETHLLLAGTGFVTVVPLVFFTSAARRLPLSTVGFLQYLAPTGQFLLAVLAFGEPLAHDRLAAFALIWAGLAVFSVDLYRVTSGANPGLRSSRARSSS